MGVPPTWPRRGQDLRLKVSAGHGNPDRRVDWTHSADVADPVPWLGGGELVLKTGLGLPGWSDNTRRGCVRQLASAGVVAVGFGVSLSHARMPGALAEVAEGPARHGLPLFPTVREECAVVLLPAGTADTARAVAFGPGKRRRAAHEFFTRTIPGYVRASGAAR